MFCILSCLRACIRLRTPTLPLILPQLHYFARELCLAAPEQNFTYHISAAFSAKQKKICPSNIFDFDPFILYSNSLQANLQAGAGQDAFFVASCDNNRSVVVGVSDGVGGYDEIGIDSSQFSQGLCRSIAESAQTHQHQSIHPVTLISDGYRRILEESTISGGASTACVGVFKNTGKFIAANLGDSGFIIIHSGKVLYTSSAQTHSFNCPLQLAMVPKSLWTRTKRFGGDPLVDSPSDAFVSTHTLYNGDVVLFATDGVWDNLTKQEVLRIISHEMTYTEAWVVDKDGIKPSPKLSKAVGEGRVQTAIARSIVAKAKSASQNSKLDGPFAKEVQRLYPNENFHGGKIDDICVIAAVVERIS